LIEVLSPATTSTTCPTNPQAPLPPPPPPHLPSDPPPSSDCAKTTPNGQGKKRKRSTTRTPQKKRDKEKPPKLNKKYPLPSTPNLSTVTPSTYVVSHKKKWKANLNHPAIKEPHAIVITEHHLPFGHKPSYVTKSGWKLHIIQVPYKRTKMDTPH